MRRRWRGPRGTSGTSAGVALRLFLGVHGSHVEVNREHGRQAAGTELAAPATLFDACLGLLRNGPGGAADEDSACRQGGADATEEHEIQPREGQATGSLHVSAAALFAEYGAVLIIGGCGCLRRPGEHQHGGE